MVLQLCVYEASRFASACPTRPQVQVQDYERIKAQLAQEQRSPEEWKEICNYQNLKLNIVVGLGCPWHEQGVPLGP